MRSALNLFFLPLCLLTSLGGVTGALPPVLFQFAFPVLFVTAMLGRQEREEPVPCELPVWLAPCVFLIALAVLLVLYRGILGGGFFEDDDWRFLTTAQGLVGAGSISRFFDWLLWSHEPWPQVRMGAYPLWVFNYLVSGTNALTFHLTNVLFHAVNAALVFYLSWLLCGRILPSAGAAAAFTVFPLAAEPVTLYYGISDILCGTCFLVSLIAFLLHLRGRGGYWVSVLAALCAVFTKEYGLVLPLLLLAADLLFSKDRIRPRLVRTYLPFVAVVVLNLCWRVVMYAHAPGAYQFGLGRGVFSVQVADSVRSILVRLPRALCAPMDGRWERFIVPGYFAAWKQTFIALWVLMLTGLWWLKTPPTRSLVAAVACIVIPAIPVHNALADIEWLERARYFYISSVGLCLLVGWIALQSKWLVPALCCLLVLYAGLALQNNLPRVYEGKLAAKVADQVESIGRTYPSPSRLVVVGAFKDRAGYNVVFPGRFERWPLFERFAFEGTYLLREEDARVLLTDFEFGELDQGTHVFRWNAKDWRLEDVTPLIRELASRRKRLPALPRLYPTGDEGEIHNWSSERDIDPLAVSEIEVEAACIEPPHPPIPERSPGKFWKQSSLTLFWAGGPENVVTVKAIADGQRRRYRIPVRNSLNWLQEGTVSRLGIVASFASYPGREEPFAIRSTVFAVRLVPFR